MTAIQLVNDISALLVVLVCWWLAHQNAASPEPLGRCIAAGYGVLGMLVGAVSAFKWTGADGRLLHIALNFALFAVLFMVAVRLYILHERGQKF